MKVLISGAGIAGPTLAFWLRQYGIAPTLVESATALRTGGYVIDFWGLGYDIAEAESGRVVVTAKPGEAHLNPSGTVHGGLAATLLDSCMGLAIWSTLEKGLGQTTLEFKVSLVRPITPETGVISAEGIVLNRGRRIGTAEGRITDSRGRLLVHGTTTCLIFEG